MKIIFKYILLLFSLTLFSQGSLGASLATRDAEENNVKIQPEITVDDNTIKPSLTFSSNGKAFDFEHVKWLFEFSANSGVNIDGFDDPVESSEEIISEYVADGGNIEFDLSLMWSSDNRRNNKVGFGIYAGPFYSLLTTDAIATEENSSSVISVDTEVYGFQTEVSYRFKQITAFARAATYDTTDDGVNADFTDILDDGESLGFGVDIPLSVISGSGTEPKDNGYVLRFERTKHSEVDRAIFRVSITKAFEFLD